MVTKCFLCLYMELLESKRLIGSYQGRAFVLIKRSPIILIRSTLTFSGTIFGGFRSKGENRARSVEAWFESVEYCAISERILI